MTTYRLSYSHAFRRWYGKPLTRTEETLVSHLERQRYLTGRVRAVISVPEADQAIAENILLQYTVYLHRRFWPWCETMVVDTGTARTRRMIKDDSIVFRPGSRNGGTRGFGTFHHVIGLRMDRYGISLKGDPRGWDAIANLRNSVPDVPNTCVLLVGTYRKRSWRAFSSTYRARLQNNNPDHPYICLDVASLPPMQARPALRRNVGDIASVSKPHAPAAGRYVESHGIPAGTTSETLSPISEAVTSAPLPVQPAPRRRLHQVSRGLRRPQADLPADTSPRKPQPAAWQVAHSPQSAGGACHSTTPCERRRRRTSSGSDTIPGTRHKPRQRAQSRPRRQPRPAKTPSTPLTPLNSFNFLSLPTFRPFVPKKPPKLCTHAAAAAAA